MRAEDGSTGPFADQRLLLDLKGSVRVLEGGVHAAKRDDVERGLYFGRRPNVPSKPKPISIFSLIEVVHRSDISIEDEGYYEISRLEEMRPARVDSRGGTKIFACVAGVSGLLTVFSLKPASTPLPVRLIIGRLRFKMTEMLCMMSLAG